MVEYYLPARMLRKQVVASIYNLTNEMTTIGGGVPWGNSALPTGVCP